MNIETDFRRYMERHHHEIRESDAQWQESRRVWFGASLNMLVFTFQLASGAVSDAEAAADAFAQAQEFWKRVNRGEA